MATSEESDDSSRDEVFYNQVVELIIKIIIENLIFPVITVKEEYICFSYSFYLSYLPVTLVVNLNFCF